MSAFRLLQRPVLFLSACRSIAAASVPRRRILFGLALLTLPAAQVHAQRVLIFEDFETSTPDLPANEAVASLGSFTRSEVLPNDPGTITVTGGQFPDPFVTTAAADFNGSGRVDGLDLLSWQRGFSIASGAAKSAGDANADGAVNAADRTIWETQFGTAGGGSNKSLLLYNPNNAVQQAANWFNIFPDDASNPNFFFKNGTIEFDVFLQKVPSNGYWTYFEVRLGFELTGEAKGQVATTGDQNIWNSFRMQEAGIAPNPANTLYDQANARTYADNSVILVDKKLRVRYEINGVRADYSIFVDNLEDAAPAVKVIDKAPWTKIFNFNTFQNEPAPGINEISFMTDASARGIGSQASGNVYFDNFRVVDFDQPPAATAAVASVPEPASCGLAAGLLACGFALRRGGSRRTSFAMGRVAAPTRSQRTASHGRLRGQ
jgi:hypothetical protein